jgi:ComF family protein
VSTVRHLTNIRPCPRAQVPEQVTRDEASADGSRFTALTSRRVFGAWPLTTLVDAVLAVIFAPACASCGEPLERPTYGPVCVVCWHSILPLTPPLCETCGDPLATWRVEIAAAQCPRCRRTRSSVDRARAIGAYDGALRAVVHALKYEGRRSVAPRLAALMRHRGADMLEKASFVVPVPLHRSRRRQRGFNQADDLARHLGLPVRRALRRLRATPSQAALPAAQRHRNVRDAFATTRAAGELRGKVVVLVDDVCTTGATLEACARPLKAAGVIEVRALTAARVVTLPRQ